MIKIFPYQLLIPSWPQHSTTYVALKDQVGCVVTGVFINLAHRNAALKRSLETELWVKWMQCVCVCVSAKCMCVCCQYNLRCLILRLPFLVAPSTLVIQDHKFHCKFLRETGRRGQRPGRTEGVIIVTNCKVCWNKAEGTTSGQSNRRSTSMRAYCSLMCYYKS